MGLVKHICFALLFFTFCQSPFHAQLNPMDQNSHLPQNIAAPNAPLETITLGAGCFWCVEAVFEGLQGVHSAQSGYMGGHIKNPGYREVCTGRTGHAEVVQIVYDTTVLSTETLLEVFFSTHDPTTLNRQGADAGTQYRSAIYFHSTDQQNDAIEAVTRAQDEWSNQIVTEVTIASEFYIAEDYHQAYYELNGEAPYCQAVILPKMQKVRSAFQHLLKIN
jgi:peptide-methionine (S)-S-oxide reductase